MLQISGAHWALLQGGAWAGMLVARAARTDVATAVETTFDGAHPCRMCLAVQDGQKEQQQREKESRTSVVSEMLKANFLLPQRVALTPPVAVRVEFAPEVFFGVSRSLAPLTEPPRAV